jgi:hypothetical protein
MIPLPYPDGIFPRHREAQSAVAIQMIAVFT